MTSQEISPELATADEPDELPVSIDRLTMELWTLRNTLGEIREDFALVMRNDLPRSYISYVHIKRMALDPCAEDWGEKLEIERGEFSVRRSAIDFEQLEHLVENFETMIDAVAAMRLELILTALDGVRAELVKAIQNSKREDEWEPRGGVTPIDPEVSILTVRQPTLKAPKKHRRKVIASDADKVGSRNEAVPQAVMASIAKHDAKPPVSRDDDSQAVRKAKHDQWCREIRDPAIEHSEGRRTITSAKDEARLEYEIAPLPVGGWAVNWQYGFLGGSKGGASHPWVRLATREECLHRVVSAAREFFAGRPFDNSQQAAYREMQRRLGGGLFGFIEPEPVRDRPPRPS